MTPFYNSRATAATVRAIKFENDELRRTVRAQAAVIEDLRIRYHEAVKIAVQRTREAMGE